MYATEGPIQGARIAVSSMRTGKSLHLIGSKLIVISMDC